MASIARITSVEKSVEGPRRFTHAEIAPMFGITRSRVQQIEQRALKKIHRALSGQARAQGLGIREFLFGDTE